VAVYLELHRDYYHAEVEVGYSIVLLEWFEGRLWRHYKTVKLRGVTFPAEELLFAERVRLELDRDMLTRSRLFMPDGVAVALNWWHSYAVAKEASIKGAEMTIRRRWNIEARAVKI